MFLGNDSDIRIFFSEKTIQLKLFSVIYEYVNSLGPIKIRVSKSQISFAGKRQFAWVWMPMKWDKKRPQNCIVLSFSQPERINNPRIVEAVEPYLGRWMHHVIIQQESDFDSLVKKWLYEAYNYSS